MNTVIDQNGEVIQNVSPTFDLELFYEFDDGFQISIECYKKEEVIEALRRHLVNEITAKVGIPFFKIA